MTRSTPIVIDTRLIYINEEGQNSYIILDSSEWYAWLSSVDTDKFRFSLGNNIVGFRKHEQDNTCYWRGYLTVNKERRRRYAGRSCDLSYAVLSEITRQLVSGVKEQIPIKLRRTMTNEKRDSLYFFTSCSFVKIGRTANPINRLRIINTSSPEEVNILAVIPDKGHLEDYCHDRLKHLHKRLEWFNYTKEVDDLIKEIIENGPLI